MLLKRKVDIEIAKADIEGVNSLLTLFLSANIERNYWFRDGYQMI